MQSRLSSSACVLLAGGWLLACAAAPAPTPASAPQLDEDQQRRRERLCAEGAWEPGTPAHCECLNGYVRGDIGDGKVACPAGEVELERVQQGIEGAICCAIPKP